MHQTGEHQGVRDKTSGSTRINQDHQIDTKALYYFRGEDPHAVSPETRAAGRDSQQLDLSESAANPYGAVTVVDDDARRL